MSNPDPAKIEFCKPDPKRYDLIICHVSWLGDEIQVILPVDIRLRPKRCLTFEPATSGILSKRYLLGVSTDWNRVNVDQPPPKRGASWSEEMCYVLPH